jgi:hypothetical protein
MEPPDPFPPPVTYPLASAGRGLLRIARLLLGLLGLGVASLEPGNPSFRVLLALTSLATSGLRVSDLGRLHFHRQRPLPRCREQVAQSTLRFLGPEQYELGWSYGEVRARVFAELGIQVRGILALVSLFSLALAGTGLFYLSSSRLTIYVVEITLWGGLALSLHLGWRGWRILRAEQRALMS